MALSTKLLHLRPTFRTIPTPSLPLRFTTSDPFSKISSLDEIYNDLSKFRQFQNLQSKKPNDLLYMNELKMNLDGKYDSLPRSVFRKEFQGIGGEFIRGTIAKLAKLDVAKKTNVNVLGIDMLNNLGAERDFILSPPKEHLAEKYFHPDNMSSAENLKIELKKVRDETDRGSARMQVTQLTTKIKHFSTALHKKESSDPVNISSKDMSIVNRQIVPLQQKSPIPANNIYYNSKRTIHSDQKNPADNKQKKPAYQKQKNPADQKVRGSKFTLSQIAKKKKKRTIHSHGYIPERTRFPNQHKGRMKGISYQGNHICFGKYALQVLEPARITSRQILAGREAIKRHARGRDRKLWVRIFADKPVTKKPAETRMGRGKGPLQGWEVVVKPGRIIYEMSGVSEKIARKTISIAASKMSVRTRFIILG